LNADMQARVVLLAGVCAALHVGKLSPAITALQQALGLTLVQAGFLLSLVQLAGMLAGVAIGSAVDGLGLRRSMALGSSVLAVSSALGAAVDGVLPLLVLRAVESVGFLLVVLPGPGLLRRLLPADRVNGAMGLWGAYMPLGVALALLAGPSWIEAFGWRSWWLALAAASAVMAWLVPRAIRPLPALPQGSAAPGWSRLRQTLSAKGPWLVAAAFAVYSSQWLAVIGFLPAIYQQAGVSGAATGALSAAAAGVNMVGNIASGRWLQRGTSPARLVSLGFVAMALAAAAAFASPGGSELPPAWRYAAILLFSMAGGVIPAALFSLAVRFAPGERMISTTMGWVQQWSAMGQFAGPPLVSWVASRAGGWHWTWAVTGTLAAVGLVLAWRIARRLGR
jgi:CP family cyanate transporter-like MFS transporter